MKINKKKLILTILIIVAVIITAVLLYRFFTKNNIEVDSDENLFPFGEVKPGDSRSGNGNQESTGVDSSGEQSTINDDGIPVFPQLRLIHSQPTGGMVSIIRDQEKEVVNKVLNEEGEIAEELQVINVKNNHVRYSKIADSTIFETKVHKNEPLKHETIIENFIPNTEHSIFSPDGSSVAFQYWNNSNRTIETFFGKIGPLSYSPEVCPYNFEGPITLDVENDSVFSIHQFLNSDPRTRLAESGLNSPGNESYVAGEYTIKGIETFQEIHDLEVDGALGTETRRALVRVCDELEEIKAKEIFENSETKYVFNGNFLPSNITSLNISPDSESVFYINNVLDSVIGVSREIETGDERHIFNSPYTEWTSFWNSDEYIELLTQPSYGSLGYSYELNAENGEYYKSFKERDGLITLPSRDDNNILVFDTVNDEPSLSIYNRLANSFDTLLIQSFTDKCVWTYDSLYVYCAVPDNLAFGNEYPDTWYQGLETYSDSLWGINIETLEEFLISNLDIEYDQKIDVEKITISEDNQYLYFIDKNTEHLWSFRINP